MESFSHRMREPVSQILSGQRLRVAVSVRRIRPLRVDAETNKPARGGIFTKHRALHRFSQGSYVLAGYSAFRPASLTTFPHFVVSA